MAKSLFNKPRIRQGFTVEQVASNAVFLLSEHRHFVFEGAVYPALIPLLDGERNFGEILAKLGQAFSLQDVYVALLRLARSNCIVEADGITLPDHLPFWDQLSVAARVQPAFDRLRETTLSVQTVGAQDGTLLEAALVQAGLRVQADGEVLVVMTDDYLREELAAINQSALARQRPWVLLKPDGVVLWVGPLFLPGKTGCWQCLEHRLNVNRQVERYIRLYADHPVHFATSKAKLASTLRVGMDMAAVEIAKSIAFEMGAGLAGKILTLDLIGLKFDEHILVQRPQCPACGQPRPIAAPRAITLTSCPRPEGELTESRAVTPAETVERYKHHISPITGIVTSFFPRHTDNYGMIYNYIVGHYFTVGFGDIATLRLNQIARGGGKGSSEAQAKASAIGEALERYSGLYWGDEYVVPARYDSLKPDAVHVSDLLQFSDHQYRNRHAWNAQLADRKDYIPDPFDESVEINWTPVWSLSHDRVRYLPTAFCFYGHQDPGHAFCLCNSNGCAAGNTLEEAILQGFLELVERDAVALWWYNRLRRPMVDIDSFELPYWNYTQTYYRNELQRDLHVLDLTTDFNIPTFVGISRRVDQQGMEDILLGFASHLDPKAAITQVLAEINQSIPTLTLTDSDGVKRFRAPSAACQAWWRDATYENQPYLMPDREVPAKLMADYTSLASSDLKEDVLTCVRLAKTGGLEVLVLDQTRPDIGMPVVRVVVPGLRHFWRRLRPGRLYDLPVQLGWTQQPLTEDAVNPLSCYI